MKLKFTIRRLIIGFSILITIIPISSIIYISYKFGEKSIQNFIFDHLTENVSNIKDNLNTLLSVGKNTSDTLKGLIETEVITLNNQDSFGQGLLIHLKSDPDLMSVEYADESNETVGAAREIFGRDYAIGKSGKASNFVYQLSEVDLGGQLEKIFWTVNDYDSRTTTWYKTAKESNRSLWTPIYLWPNGEFGLDFVSPINKNRNFAGVLDVSIRLNTLTNFIEDSKHYPNSQIFLLEKNGLIVAGTNVETIKTNPGGTNERIKASESSNLVLRDIDSFLTKFFSSLSTINSSSVHSVLLNNQRYTLIVDNYSNNLGVDWVVIKAVLNDDIMSAIVTNTKTEIGVMLFIFAIVLLSAIALSNYIINPLTKLVKYSESMAQGHLKTTFDINREDEIGILAQKLNAMAVKINRSIAELKKLDKLKDDFLSTTTHELKTPLVPIKSQSQMLLAGDYGKLNAEQNAAVEMIYRNEENLSMLTNEVLDISKMKSNKFALKLGICDLELLINEVVSDMTSYANEQKIALALNIKTKLPKILIDELRIRQVMSNLLGNAIKFTPENGKVVVDVKQVKNEIIVLVTDNGIGIDQQYLPKLFTPFFQIDSRISRKYRGTGLGLAISKGIIDAHGGKIWAKSDGLNKGSEFGFSLPITNRNV